MNSSGASFGLWLVFAGVVIFASSLARFVGYAQREQPSEPKWILAGEIVRTTPPGDARLERMTAFRADSTGGGL